MALYRTYRPATFAEVKGQEHVTEPLSRALDSGRINHAYLFSGPRGCGKTSSARILARSLNCEHGPTSAPCGTCTSCVALAPGGPGNLDVIELDAASHGGVDDTRDLRDRASFAPAESRYRVFIIDEAHMVTSAGFNALLKIVEEPPEHLIFIFATTEPDKVLTTIRSRTHHYPFRLLPPSVMRGLLESICAREQVAVAPEVFPLVIRAGGGSPRDSLSILDQLLAGAGEEGVVYERALALLGVTDGALIDATIDALAAADGPALFGAVEQVVEAGHDPRRFAVDLLDRIRDLILLQAVPDAAERGLVEAPGEQLARMQAQIAQLGPATLTRYAELVHTALGEMRGTTSPRLLLEVLCARLLLPGVSADDTAVLTRIEALELRPGAPAAAARPAPAPGAPAAAAPPLESGEAPKYVRPSQRKAAEQQPQVAAQAPAAQAAAPQAPTPQAVTPQAPPQQPSAPPAQAPAPQAPTPQAPAAAAPAPQAAASTAPPVQDAPQAPAPDAVQVAPSAPPQVPVEPAAEQPVAHQPAAAPAPQEPAAQPQTPTESAPQASVPQTPAGQVSSPQTAAGEPRESGLSVPPAPAAQAQAPAAQPPAATASVPQTPGAQPQAPAAPEQPVQPQAPAASAPQAARRPADGPLEYQGVPLPDEPPDYDEIPPEDAGPPRPPAPEPEPVAAAAAAEPGLTIDDIRRRWSDIVAAARSRSQVFSVILAEAVVHSVSDGAVVLGHKNEVLIGRLSEPARLAELRELFSQIFERPLDVQVTLADGPAAAAAPSGRPAGGPRGDAPAARRPTFSRPSQAARGPQGETAAPPPEPEPEPEGPAPPSGYEDFTDAERDEMLNQAKNATPDARLDPDKVALELLKNELGARPVE